MIINRVGKQIYKKCLIVLICLLVVANSTHGVVLCFGMDGHIEIEPAYHDRCNDLAHSQPANQTHFNYQSDHAKDKHCNPCVDIPISIGLAKITRVAKQSNPTFKAQAANIIPLSEKFELSAYNSTSTAFETPSYFAPLRVVILQV